MRRPSRGRQPHDHAEAQARTSRERLAGACGPRASLQAGRRRQRLDPARGRGLGRAAGSPFRGLFHPSRLRVAQCTRRACDDAARREGGRIARSHGSRRETTRAVVARFSVTDAATIAQAIAQDADERARIRGAARSRAVRQARAHGRPLGRPPSRDGRGRPLRRRGRGLADRSAEHPVQAGPYAFPTRSRRHASSRTQWRRSSRSAATSPRPEAGTRGPVGATPAAARRPPQRSSRGRSRALGRFRPRTARARALRSR